MKLHLKILAGYLLLIIQSGTDVWTVWKEKWKNIHAEHDGAYKKTLNRTFKRLLDLSFIDVYLLPGDSSTIADYLKELDMTISTLDELEYMASLPIKNIFLYTLF